MGDEPQQGPGRKPDTPEYLAKLLGHYERSFRTDIYPMPDSDLPFILARAAAMLRKCQPLWDREND